MVKKKGIRQNYCFRLAKADNTPFASTIAFQHTQVQKKENKILNDLLDGIINK